jgi:hypothetical protein
MAETKPTTTSPIAPQTTIADPTKPATLAAGTTTTPATATTPGATPTGGTTAAPAKPAEPMYPSVEDIMFVCPTAKKENVVKNLPGIVEEMAKAGLNSKNNLVGIVATIHVETEIDPFNPIEEIDGRNNASGANGGRPYSGGAEYFGRGYIQITHDYNYKDAGNGIGIGDQLVNDPKMALRPEIAAKVTSWFWKTKGVNEAADAGNWEKVRRIVNGGTHGYAVYMAAVQRGLERFTRGINSTGAINMGVSYGASDVDTGGGQSRTVVATGVQGQADILAYALNLHARDRMNSHEFYAVLDCAADPKILDLEAQKTFELRGVSKDLDGVYTVDEVTFLPLTETVQAIVKAKRPDPKAGEARAFLFDAQGLDPKAGENATPGQPGQVTKINGEVKLGVPYKSQLDNAFNPGGSCNATSLAMALEFLGVKHSGSGQFEDVIYEQLQASGLHPGTASAMVAIVEKYGKKDRHTETATDDEIRKHLDKGKPVVIHGDFTRSGHILCVIGYNAKGFIVNDPYGKFLGTLGSYDNNASGAGILHEYATVVANFWHRKGTNSAHFIE